jgi:DNA-binding transcriptional MerR regulator
MTSDVSIGEFSRLCHLSAKTPRYYHDIDLLVPAAVDGSTGYRRYSTDQVGDAHLIRRLRDLDMPLAEIRLMLAEADDRSREKALAKHLDRMESELTRTREVVLSLRRLLGAPRRVAVTHRQSPAQPVLRISQKLARGHVTDWCDYAFAQLTATLAEAGIEPAGPPGATYPPEFFEQDAGEIVAFVPVLAQAVPRGDRRFAELPQQRVAVTIHSGSFVDCDVTYGALGSHVAEHDVALSEPIVENYLLGRDQVDDPDDYQTEICWPIQ